MIVSDDAGIRRILESNKTIAMVGLSPKEDRPSNIVARYLMARGHTVIPVNPGQREILGQPCYASLKDIPVKVDMVDVFRNATTCPPSPPTPSPSAPGRSGCSSTSCTSKPPNRPPPPA